MVRFDSTNAATEVALSSASLTIAPFVSLCGLISKPRAALGGPQAGVCPAKAGAAAPVNYNNWPNPFHRSHQFQTQSEPVRPAKLYPV